MKSILENRPALAKEVNKVAEVAGYLWQKGWAERNGGNITVNITEFVDDEIRQMKPIRAELSIVACILCFGHMAVYLDSYLPRLLGNASINGNVAVAFGVAVALFVLLALLGVTSLGIVKRAMSSRRWTRIQRFAYLFFALIFCHLALMLLPAALRGGIAAQESLFIYTAMFGAYGILRLGKAAAERHEQARGNATGAPSITREEETSIGNAA